MCRKSKANEKHSDSPKFMYNLYTYTVYKIISTYNFSFMKYNVILLILVNMRSCEEAQVSWLSDQRALAAYSSCCQYLRDPNVSRWTDKTMI